MINNLEIFINWEPEAPVNIRWRGFASLQQFHRRYNSAPAITAAVCSPNSGAVLISSCGRISLDNQRSDIFHATVVPLQQHCHFGEGS